MSGLGPPRAPSPRARAHPLAALAGVSPARAAGLALALVLPLYLCTMNRTIGFIDRGELAATAYTLGIPHPTGYPTFTFLGWIASHLTPLRPVLALNLFAALMVAASAVVLVLLFDHLLSRVGSQPPAERILLALLASLFTALTVTWWDQANGFEVYALHVLFLPLLLLLFLRWLDGASEPVESGPPGPRAARVPGGAFAFLLGLSLTNHMTTVLWAPGLLVFAYARLGGFRRLLASVVPLIPAFLLGLLPYAWLPIRSAMGPRFDWGGTHTLHGLIDHLTAREFRSWMFSGAETVGPQLRYVAYHLARDLGWAGVVPALLGAVLLARRRPALAATTALLIGVPALFACGYHIRELESYLLGCVLGLGILVAAGLLGILERFGSRWALATGLCLAALNGVLHWHDCDESRNRLVEDLTTNELESLPPRAVLFTRQWDYSLAASYYFQEVEGLRRDVVVVSPDLLRYGWYVDELARRAPALWACAGLEGAEYRAALRPFERHRPFAAGAIQAARWTCIDSLCARAMRQRPVLCTSEMDTLLRGPWTQVPIGLALELRPDSAYRAESPPRYRFEPWVGHMDGFIATTHWIYASSFARRADYERAHGRPGLCRRYLELATRVDPGIRLDRVPPLPLDGNPIVAQTAGFFARLSRRAPNSP